MSETQELSVYRHARQTLPDNPVVGQRPRAAARAIWGEPIDAVYTWVDDRCPTFRHMRESYALTDHDRDPCRARDNLDLLKYSLRSLHVCVPWIRHVYIVTCAPLRPRWLTKHHPNLSIVHHDSFIDAAFLPTFNSFAIASYFAKIPGASRRLLYINDDMVFDSPVSVADLTDNEGRLRVFPRLRVTRHPKQRHRDDISRWNAGVAHANHLLDMAFGRVRRHDVNHVPLLVDLDSWEEMIRRWPDDFDRTRRSRFRSKYNVPHGHFYPYYLLAMGRARMESFARSYRDVSYCALENSVILTRLRLAGLAAYRRKFVCYNDGMGSVPNPRVISMVRDFLERRYPVKSPYED